MGVTWESVREVERVCVLIRTFPPVANTDATLAHELVCFGEFGRRVPVPFKGCDGSSGSISATMR